MTMKRLFCLLVLMTSPLQAENIKVQSMKWAVGAHATARITKDDVEQSRSEYTARTPYVTYTSPYWTILKSGVGLNSGQQSVMYNNNGFTCEAEASSHADFSCPLGPTGTINIVASDDMPKIGETCGTVVGGNRPPKICCTTVQAPYVYVEPTIVFSNPVNQNTVVTAYIRLYSGSGAGIINNAIYRVSFEDIDVEAIMIPVVGGNYVWWISGTKKAANGQIINIDLTQEGDLDFSCYSYHTINRAGSMKATAEINGDFDVRNDDWFNRGIWWTQCNDGSGNPAPIFENHVGFARIQLTPL